MKKSYTFVGVITVLAAVGLLSPAAYAALTYPSQLTQQINPGTLSTDIRTSAGAVVGSPSFAMSAVNVSNSQQVSTGTFGDAEQRITVDNPGGGGATGWTLTLNATVPNTGTWTGGAGSYPYNSTVALGQLTVNATPATLTAPVGGLTGITKGVSTTFSGSSSVTLMSAGGTAAKIWNGYLTGVTLSQTIPASQPAGTYTLNMTQTVAAV